MSPHPKVRRQLRRGRRGQAMVEYSILTWALVIALVLGVSVRMVPGPGGTRQNVIELFIQAYRSYYDSFYFMLSLPYP